MKNIIVYTIPNCYYCKKVKKFLAEKNVKFRDVDVKSNKTFAKEMIIKSGQKNVPVLDIEGEIIFRIDSDTGESLINKIKEKLK